MTTLSPEMPAPDFTLPDHDGTPIHLADFRGQKVILYFYPAAGTPGCTTQACDFRDNLNSLQAFGYQVLGISHDSQHRLKKFHDHHHLTFPLLSDENLSVHHAYGTHGEKKLYGKTVVGVRRSTFVIDENGILIHTFYNVKATGHVALLRKKLGIDERS